MRIGVPKEIKNHEYRVGLVPAGVRELVSAGHQVWVQSTAGEGVGIADAAFAAAGARIVAEAAEVFSGAELIVKVKEPQLSECARLNRGQVVFTYLHLAADLEQAHALLASGASAIGYETVTALDGSLPLLTPMSEVAGRMAVQVGAVCLQKTQGGSGVLLGGVAGIPQGKVVILGGGVAGTNAAAVALGMRADVTVIERSVQRLRVLDESFSGRVRTLMSTTEVIESQLAHADLIIGAVLIPGAAAPRLVTRDMVRRMRPGTVMVDISIDQGGCFETSRPTTHDDPTFQIDGVVHYCVTNMPAAVSRSSTFALTNATLPYVKALADRGLEQALLRDPYFARGLNVHAGAITHEAVAQELDLPYRHFRAASVPPAA